MMRAVHFGAGNIGRGFIGEVLYKNGFCIDFVDVNDTLINALQRRTAYEIELAGGARERISVSGVNGINSKTDPEAVVRAICSANLVTTAIGPKILPFIAELIAKGITARHAAGSKEALDVIACENMIGGSVFLRGEVEKYIPAQCALFFNTCVGFPNAAVDRIVPAQQHTDPLFVTVEPFKEWVIDDSARKAKHITLCEVEYAKDLQPFIERKLFSVNSGHATCAYTGYYYGHRYINQALADGRVLTQLQNTLAETGKLLITKWGFSSEAHQKYIHKIIERFSNPAISDDIPRVARTPIRKLGYDERFIRPIRELRERGLSYATLLSTTAYILRYNETNDEESARLQEMLATQETENVIKTITGLNDAALIAEIAEAYRRTPAR